MKISKANFAVANLSSTIFGTFGIGPRYRRTIGRTDEAAEFVYDNIPIQLKQQGHISAVAYSIYLDHSREDAGTLLFGGVNHAKYKGNLGIVPVLRGMPPMYKDDEGMPEPFKLTVMLHGIGVKDTSGNKQNVVECSIPVELNTGDSRSKLPGNFIKAIARALNAAYSDGARGYILPCATAGSIELNFSGVKVAVSIGDALIRLFDTNDGVYTDTNGHPMCVLGFTAGSDGLPHTSEEFFLGESILRGLWFMITRTGRLVLPARTLNLRRTPSRKLPQKYQGALRHHHTCLRGTLLATQLRLNNLFTRQA